MTSFISYKVFCIRFFVLTIGKLIGYTYFSDIHLIYIYYFLSRNFSFSISTSPNFNCSIIVISYLGRNCSVTVEKKVVFFYWTLFACVPCFDFKNNFVYNWWALLSSETSQKFFHMLQYCSTSCWNSFWDVPWIRFFLYSLSFCLSFGIYFLGILFSSLFLPQIILCIDHRPFFVVFLYFLNNNLYLFLGTFLCFFRSTFVVQS